MYDGKGDYIGELDRYEFDYYKSSKDYCQENKLKNSYLYYGVELDYDEIELLTLSEYFGKGGYTLSDEYGYVGQKRATPSHQDKHEQHDQGYNTFNVMVNASNGGSVNGGGSFKKRTSCTVTATANSGYKFTNWTENGSEVSTNASYTFIVSSNRNLVANFGAQPQPKPGPQPFQVWQPCGYCGGSGQCQTCLGLGHSLYGTDRCWNCGGNGKCTHCAGQGGRNVIDYR